MISGDIHHVERLALRAGILDMRAQYDAAAAKKQDSLFKSGVKNLIVIFDDHNHSEESAARIREDLTDAILLVPGLQEIAEAVEAVVKLRTPVPAPHGRVETDLLMRIGAVAAEEAAKVYPGDAHLQLISTVAVYCALIVYGPVGAKLPWENQALAKVVRRRVSAVPSLLDAPGRDR